MCNGYGCCGYDGEEMTTEDLQALYDEKEKILEAKLATVRHMRDSLKDKKKSDKSE